MVKQRNDSSEAYKAGRKEALETELSEIAIISEFLPKQLSDEEMKKICLEKIKEVGVIQLKIGRYWCFKKRIFRCYGFFKGEPNY